MTTWEMRSSATLTPATQERSRRPSLRSTRRTTAVRPIEMPKVMLHDRIITINVVLIILLYTLNVNYIQALATTLVLQCTLSLHYHLIVPCDDPWTHVVREREAKLPVDWRILDLHRRREDTAVEGDTVATRGDHLVQKLLERKK